MEETPFGVPPFVGFHVNLQGSRPPLKQNLPKTDSWTTILLFGRTVPLQTPMGEASHLPSLRWNRTEGSPEQRSPTPTERPTSTPLSFDGRDWGVPKRADVAMWAWVKSKPPGNRRFWSLVPFCQGSQNGYLFLTHSHAFFVLFGKLRPAKPEGNPQRTPQPLPWTSKGPQKQGPS